MIEKVNSICEIFPFIEKENLITKTCFSSLDIHTLFNKLVRVTKLENNRIKSVLNNTSM